MIREYTFYDDGTLEFDDTRSVRELIQYAFDEFGYFEPLGMEIVTIFQCHHSKTNVGWFTIDVGKSCAEEIENRDELCFAYHLPNVFYFAEGGWGHHMKELGNHPKLENPVSLKIKFDDFYNTVVINGKYTFNDVISFLKKGEYISDRCSMLKVYLIGILNNEYVIPFSDEIMDVRLVDFKDNIQKYYLNDLKDNEFIYYEILEIC